MVGESFSPGASTGEHDQKFGDLTGLSQREALRRLQKQGDSAIWKPRPRRLVDFLLELLKEPMVLLLLGCGLLYLALGDPTEAWVLIGFFVLILVITVHQQRRSDQAMAGLRQLASPRAWVIRDGKKRQISAAQVVIGDLVVIQEGDRVPADGRVVLSWALALDESVLTGESWAVEKKESVSPDNQDRSAHLFAGSAVVRGHGVMRVLATGLQTQMGRIGLSMEGILPEPTSLELQTVAWVRVSAWIAVGLCCVVMVSYGVTRGSALDGLLAGLTLAMAILPNELPAVLTVFLALGSWRVSQAGVLTRKKSALESLGAATVLCVDKTGTLTWNQMAIERLVRYRGDQSSAEAKGAKKVEVLDFSQAPLGELPEAFHELLEFGFLASHEDGFDPMDQAFQSAALLYLRGTEHLHRSWSLKKEYPLAPELLSISQVWQTEEKGCYQVGSKGAPEAILSLCRLGENDTAELLAQVEEMTSVGLRVLGVAKAQLQACVLPGKQQDFDFQFLGFVGLVDPIRPQVPEAIRECQQAGIRVVMMTGDHPSTAIRVAQSIGITQGREVVTGQQLRAMSQDQLHSAVQTVRVFSRVMPDQKLQIVEALKKLGEIVAMTGDGVNDAPALKSAHIGIAMGQRGTEVAREAASLILMEDDFGSIVEAIRLGRRIEANLKRAFLYLLSVHLPIAGISVLPAVFQWPLVLHPVHIAFLHLMIEPVCTIAFESDPALPEAMSRPPRKSQAILFSKEEVLSTLLEGLSVLMALFGVYFFSLRHSLGDCYGRTMTFTTLIFSQGAVILLSRSWRGSGAGSSSQSMMGGSQNWILIGVAAVASVLLFSVLSFEFLRARFAFAPLQWRDLGVCCLVGLGSVFGCHLLRKVLCKK
ncbi:MAG: cation-translocating P-type ATPase [Bdellovibrionia bacterium]